VRPAGAPARPPSHALNDPLGEPPVAAAGASTRDSDASEAGLDASTRDFGVPKSVSDAPKFVFDVPKFVFDVPKFGFDASNPISDVPKFDFDASYVNFWIGYSDARVTASAFTTPSWRFEGSKSG